MHILNRPLVIFFISVLSNVLLPSTAESQLNATISADKFSGCSPLIVSFSGGSTGSTGTPQYSWDFGNGNTSVLQSPRSVYTDPGTYTVTLTVADGSKTSGITKTITVYRSPVVDFNLSLAKGCVPLPVALTSTATPGDGSISSYFWDFGDGYTGESNSATINHTYTAETNPAISLTVTNSHGCQSSVTREKILQVLPELKVEFSPDKTSLCFITDGVTFNNTSMGPGALSYQWDFGDGTVSSEQHPKHIYQAPGSYPTKLTVTSSDGCVITGNQPTVINVANFQSDFALKDSLCEKTILEWTNLSTPVPDRSTWDFGNGNEQVKYPGQYVASIFDVPGKHTVKLTNEFGECKVTISKIFDIRPLPKLDGFLSDITTPCGSPVVVNFSDTSGLAVKWDWSFGHYAGSSNQKSPSHTYTFDDDFTAILTITDKYGCKASTNKPMKIRKPSFKINYLNSSSPDFNRSCGPLTITFEATGTEKITSFEWDFGDGSKSSAAVPTHTYTKAGDYKPILKFITEKGCSGVVEYEGWWAVRMPLKADFSVASTEICGNTPVVFQDKSTIHGNTAYFYWDISDGGYEQQYYPGHAITHKFEAEGVYTVRLIVTDLVCSDTLVRTNYIHVSPPFPKITGHTNTCDGTRGKVSFTQASKQTDSWHWDFGDGNTLLLNTDKPEVEHEYKNTGFYKVVLSTKKGGCTVKDSIYIYVLLKQYPKLSVDKMEVCASSEYAKYTIYNLEKNPEHQENNGGPFGYAFHRWEYGDGTEPDYSNTLLMPYTSDPTPNSIVMNRASHNAGKDSMRVILYTPYKGCYDTTNYVPIKFRGPEAGFIQVIADPCKGSETAVFKDLTVNTGGVATAKWEWFWGDGPMEEFSDNKSFQHTYLWPGEYPVSLRVTDANGCVDVTSGTATTLLTGLDAVIYPSSTTISPGTTVQFINGSSSTDEANTTYKWLMDDGSFRTTFNTSKQFNQPGNFTIRLVAINSNTGCSDTATVTIHVKYVNAAFTMNASFISNSSCPPVLVNFTNTSGNVTRITWDFGDGTIVRNVFNPSHVYTKPGLYYINVDTYSDNGTKYSTTDSILIKGGSGNLAADILYGCTEQSITLHSLSENIVGYAWDFGDGTLVQTTDSFAVHHYRSPGYYKPVVVITDDAGCSASVKLDKEIVIDDLQVSMGNIPASICSPKQVNFSPQITSVSGSQSPANLIYHWDFGTGNANDTSNIESPSFLYSSPGTYPVSLTVQSLFGCIKKVNSTMNVYQGLGGRIEGPAEICEGVSVSFRGNTVLPGQPSWKWIFDDGTQYSQQQPPGKIFTGAGDHIIKLVVENNACSDTIMHVLKVNPNASVLLSPADTKLCEGKSLQLIATGAASYSWSPASGLSAVTGAEVIASPTTDTRYVVTGISAAGCMGSDSVFVSVVHPHKLSLDDEITVCEGKTVALRAGGAIEYLWIENTDGLSNRSIPDPLARPTGTSTYTVVGTGEGQCFSDTARIRVVVVPAPSVDAGRDTTVLAGSTYRFNVKVNGDVSTYSWSPHEYLSCIDCIAPEVRPGQPMEYIITAGNRDGCTASDTVRINLMCSDSRIFIPNAFTPNGDGKNDVFRIIAEGVNEVTRLQVFNRFGQLVFERKNYSPDDVSAAWDGKINGQPAPVGTYIYMVELNCMKERFSRKGSVVLIR